MKPSVSLSAVDPPRMIEIGNAANNNNNNNSNNNIKVAATVKKENTDSAFYTGIKPILAGGITGAIETLILYPTEYVKTHLQLQGKTAPTHPSHNNNNNTAAVAVKGAAPPPAANAVRYNGMVDCYVKTVRANGFLGLYQGMTPVLVGTIPKQATRWGVFELNVSLLCGVKRHVLLLDDDLCQRSDLSLAEVSVCGLMAGAMEACIAAVPMDTIKTRLIDDAKASKPIFQDKPFTTAVAMMVRSEGIRGIYKGVGGTVMKQSVNQMVRFPVQQATMDVFSSSALCGGNATLMRRRRRSPFWNGFAGFIAGVVSVFLSQPFDVVKTRMQSQSGGRYNGSLDCFKKILREDGAAKMYSGCVPRMLRVGGNVALTFTLFPIVKAWL